MPVDPATRRCRPPRTSCSRSPGAGWPRPARARTPAERYAAAHLAALRAAAAVLACRARPASGRRGPRSVWVVLPEVAPELGEWAAFFAAGAGKRAAAEAGLPAAVSTREADDLLRDATAFLALVEATLGLSHQPFLPTRSRRSPSSADPSDRPPPHRPPAMPTDPFAHLHVASGYSLRYGASHPEALVARAAEHGQDCSPSPTATASTAR